jgi:HEAT repeat protein
MTDLNIIEMLEAAALSRAPDFVERAVQCAYADGLKAAYVPALIAILKNSEHHRHEDVVTALQTLKDPISADALFNAAFIEHEYLNYDEHFGLARKCTWALADIGSPEARSFLERLAASSNKFIAAFAQERLDCWEKEKQRKGWRAQS